MSEAMPPTDEEVFNCTTAAALRHAADCIDELVEKGEPMQDRQTFRRGFDAADKYLVRSGLSGQAFDDATEKVGEVAGMALDHGISGSDAATFYRNQAETIEA